MTRTKVGPFVELGHYDLHPESIRMLPFQFCVRNEVVVAVVRSSISSKRVTTSRLDRRSRTGILGR